MRVYFTSFMALLTMLCSGALFAQTEGRSPYSSDSEIAKVLQETTREFDPNAIVLVKSSKKTALRKVKVPGVPFLTEEVDVINDFDKEKNEQSAASDRISSLLFAKIDVTIFSSTGSVPQGVLSILRKISLNYSESVDFNVERLPKDFLVAKEKPTPVATVAPQNSPQSPLKEEKVWEPKLNEALSRILEVLERGQKMIEELPNQILDTKAVAKIVFIAMTSAFLLFAVILFFMQKRMNTSLDSGLQGVRAALEQNGRSFSQPSRQSSEASSGLRAVTSNGSIMNSHQGLGAIPDEGLLALLSDCYWTKQDTYGAFLWRRISPERKILLLKLMPALTEYGRYLTGQKEADLGVDQDPAYLQPLGIWHLDMMELTDLVRKQPELITRLSPLRLSALLMSPKERIALYGSARNDHGTVIPKIPENYSPIRPLKLSLPIQIRSDEDEIEILSLRDVSVAVMAEVQSLGWLLRLSEEKIAEILRGFSARDLARAWVGPPRVLEEISKRLGDKKLEMLNSLLEQENPSRDSEEFRQLHQIIIEEVRKLNTDKPRASKNTDVESSDKGERNAS